MKTTINKMIVMMALLGGFIGCLSVSQEDVAKVEAITRAVSGYVPQGGTVALLVQEGSEEGCTADAIHATDTEGETTSDSIGEDCFFSLDLEVEKSYALSLSRGDQFVATVLFRNEDGDDSFSVPLEDGSEISLGVISILGSNAFPGDDSFEPSELDGNEEQVVDELTGETIETTEKEEQEAAVETEEALESSLEGEVTLGDIGEEPLSPGEPRIVRATPANGAQDVALDELIKVRTSCLIDPISVDTSIFNVGDSEGDHLICKVSLSDSQNEVVCEHNGLRPRMNYTLTVEGLHCLEEKDGSVRSLTWHFKTK